MSSLLRWERRGVGETGSQKEDGSFAANIKTCTMEE